MRESTHVNVDFGSTILNKGGTYFSLPLYIGSVNKYSFILVYNTPSAAATNATVYFQYANDPSPRSAKNGSPAQSATVTGQFTPLAWTTPSSGATFTFTAGSAVDLGAMIDNVETQTNWIRAVISVDSGSAAATINVSSAQLVAKTSGAA